MTRPIQPKSVHANGSCMRQFSIVNLGNLLDIEYVCDYHNSEIQIRFIHATAITYYNIKEE